MTNASSLIFVDCKYKIVVKRFCFNGLQKSSNAKETGKVRNELEGTGTTISHDKFGLLNS